MLHTTLLCGGATAVLFLAATRAPVPASPADAVRPAATAIADHSLLLVLAADDDGATLLHASRLPLAPPPAAPGEHRHRVRLLGPGGDTLATAPFALPDLHAPVDQCRGPGCSHAGPAARVPAVGAAAVAQPARSAALAMPLLPGVAGIAVERRDAAGWRIVHQTLGADFAAALAAGEQLHGNVTYGAVPVDGGGR